MNNFKSTLQKQSKEWLIEQLITVSEMDEAVADRINLNLSAQSEDGPKCIAKFKSQVKKAVQEIDDHGPGSWNSQLPTAGFDRVADALALMLPKNAEAVIEISEYALVKLDGIFEMQDECELEHLVDAFRDLHLEACIRLRPDPHALAKRLAEIAQQTEWGFFNGPPDGYSKILGKHGIKTFASASSAAAK